MLGDLFQSKSITFYLAGLVSFDESLKIENTKNKQIITFLRGLWSL